MATMACYPPFDQSNNTSSTQQQVQQTTVSINNNNNRSIATTNTPQPQKDYSKPLHVDCSVEYELPNQARPPGKSEPLLMIHPCFYRRAESQRRSPFINNLPQPVQQQTPQSSVQTTRRSSTRSTSSSNNASQVLLLQQQQQRYAVQQQQQQQLRYMEQVQQQQQQAYQQTMVSSAAWSLAEQNPAAIYCKPPTTRTTRRNSRKTAVAAKELAQLSRVPDYTSSGDSGISGVLWTDTERSPAHTGLGTLDTITLPTPHPLDKALLNASAACGASVAQSAGLLRRYLDRYPARPAEQLMLCVCTYCTPH
ncbi:hypothetical protein B566_EDAN004483 [Ephemera danica]|nr:hypothetical protein B566_EDAN004483 [Ephemera danica]